MKRLMLGILLLSSFLSFELDAQINVFLDCTDGELLNVDQCENLSSEVVQPQVCTVTSETRNPNISGTLPDSVYALFTPNSYYSNTSIAFYLNKVDYHFSCNYDIDLVIVPPAIDQPTFTRRNQFKASIIELDKDYNYSVSATNPKETEKFFTTDVDKIDTLRLFENVKITSADSKVSLVIQSQFKLPEATKFTHTYKLVKIILTPHSDTSVEQVSQNGLKYRLIENAAVVTGTEGQKESLSIPESIEHESNTYTVVGIDPYAFSDVPSLERIVIPQTITHISDYAFWGNQSIETFDVDTSNPNYKSEEGVLYSKDGTRIISFPLAKEGHFTIPDEVTAIQPKIFAGSKLKSLEIPKDLYIPDSTTFEDVAIDSLVLHTRRVGTWFEDNICLRSVVLAKEVEELEPSVFSGCKKLASVNIEGGALTSISSRAFSECTSLKTISLPIGLTTLGEYAFLNCSSIETVTIPSSVKNLGEGLFADCVSLKEVQLPDTIDTIYEQAFSGCKELATVAFPKEAVAIRANAFAGCTSIEYVILQGQKLTVDDAAFRDCSNIKRADLNYPKIGRTFIAMKNLEEVSFGPLVEQIGIVVDMSGMYIINGYPYVNPLDPLFLYEGSAFSATGLKRVVIPSNVKIIANTAFADCEQLSEVICESEPDFLGAYAFYHTPWYENLPDGIVYIGNSAYSYKGEMPENYTVEIKEGTKTIAPVAFNEQPNCVAVKLPNSIKRIGLFAFTGCNIEKVEIPSSFGYFNYAFDRNLKELSILNPQTYIDKFFIGPADGAWRIENRSLKKLTINSKVVSDLGCRELETVILGDSVQWLSSEAFMNYPKLENITFPESLSCIEANALKGTLWLDNQPDGVVYAGKVAYTWKGDNTCDTLVIADGTLGIAFNMIRQDSVVKTLVIPASVTDISSKAFYGYENLTEVYLKAAIPPRVDRQIEINDNNKYRYFLLPNDLYGEEREKDELFLGAATEVHVPIGSKAAYEAHPAWGKYTIVEYDATGIRSIKNEEMNNTIYDLQGRRVMHPKQGEIYIQKGKKYINK